MRNVGPVVVGGPLEYILLRVKLDPHKWIFIGFNGGNVFQTVGVVVVGHSSPETLHVESKYISHYIRLDTDKNIIIIVYIMSAVRKCNNFVNLLRKVCWSQTVFMKIYGDFFLCKLPQNVWWCLQQKR